MTGAAADLAPRAAGGAAIGLVAGGPGWRRLVRHSYRVAGGWASRVPRRGLAGARGAAYRALVPLEPWRYHELARVAEAPLSGRVLDVGSPKLLASLLRAEGRIRITAIDLLPGEIALWRRLDPALDLEVADARGLPYADGAFDAALCVSVLEHVPGDGDARAMAELWRVLRPGGELHLTTNVVARAGDVLTRERRYGTASAAVGARHFFERRYDPATLARRLLALPWEVVERECARERRPVHRRFFAARPWSFALGWLLPVVCVRNFAPPAGLHELGPGEHAVVYLRLRRPAA